LAVDKSLLLRNAELLLLNISSLLRCQAGTKLVLSKSLLRKARRLWRQPLLSILLLLEPILVQIIQALSRRGNLRRRRRNASQLGLKRGGPKIVLLREVLGCR